MGCELRACTIAGRPLHPRLICGIGKQYCRCRALDQWRGDIARSAALGSPPATPRLTVRFVALRLRGQTRADAQPVRAAGERSAHRARCWRRSCSPSRSTRPTTTSLPDGLELSPGCFVLVPFGPQQRIGVVWDGAVGEHGQAHRRQEAENHHRHARRRAAAAAELAALCRMGGALHAGAARHGGAHDDGRARRVRAGQAALRRDVVDGRARAAAYDAGPQARARDRRRRG